MTGNYCSNCGKMISDENMNFCPNCGKPVLRSSEPEQTNVEQQPLESVQTEEMQNVPKDVAAKPKRRRAKKPSPSKGTAQAEETQDVPKAVPAKVDAEPQAEEPTKAEIAQSVPTEAEAKITEEPQAEESQAKEPVQAEETQNAAVAVTAKPKRRRAKKPAQSAVQEEEKQNAPVAAAVKTDAEQPVKESVQAVKTQSAPKTAVVNANVEQPAKGVVQLERMPVSTSSKTKKLPIKKTVQAEKKQTKKGITDDQRNVGLAAALSVFIPGLGQVYNGKTLKGLAFVSVMLIGVFLIWTLPGLRFAMWGINHIALIIFFVIIWVWGIYDAYDEATQMNKGKKQYKKAPTGEIAAFFIFMVVLAAIIVVIA